LNRSTIEEVCRLSFPVILKPNFEGSSKGISEASVFGSSTELIRYISENDISDNAYLAEEYIHGREFTVAALISEHRPVICRPMEVIFRNSGLYNVYGFEVKKTGDHHVYFDYAPDISPRIEEKIKKTSAEVIKALGVRDLARLDFRLSPSGEPYFIEINPLPGLAKNYSDFPNIFRENGIGFDELIGRIVENAKERMRQCYE
jgi:D-alanine-D-alanine ligase